MTGPRFYTVDELCTTHDCLTPGCPRTAVAATDRCDQCQGRTDTGADLPVARVNTNALRIAEAKARRET